MIYEWLDLNFMSQIKTKFRVMLLYLEMSDGSLRDHVILKPYKNLKSLFSKTDMNFLPA